MIAELKGQNASLCVAVEQLQEEETKMVAAETVAVHGRLHRLYPAAKRKKEFDRRNLPMVKYALWRETSPQCSTAEEVGMNSSMQRVVLVLSMTLLTVRLANSGPLRILVKVISESGERDHVPRKRALEGEILL
jgi:hypothetical protein